VKGSVMPVDVGVALCRCGEAVMVGKAVNTRAFEPVFAVELLHGGGVAAMLVHAF